MSIVIFCNETMAGDSLAVTDEGRMIVQKVFPWRTTFGVGLIGFTGNFAVGNALIKAWTTGGVEAVNDRSAALIQQHENLWCSLIIAQQDCDYLLISGGGDSLSRVAKQPLAIGYSTGIVQAQAFMRNFPTALAGEILDMVLDAANGATEVYCSAPGNIYHLDLSEYQLNSLQKESIEGQYIL